MDEAEQVVLKRFASARDPEAFRELVERHRDMVYAACHRVLGNPADAEDAAQECFLQLVHKADRLHAPIGGWLHHVATNAAIDLRRRKEACANRDVIVAQQRPIAQEPTWDDIKAVVDEAIAGLPEELRLAIVLHYLEGRCLNETGAQLGITGRAVSKRLARAVERLQAQMRKGGWILSVAALGALLAGNAAEAAPITLVASLGKMALASFAAPAAPGGAALAGTASKGALLGKSIIVAAVAGAVVIAGAVTMLPSRSSEQPSPLTPVPAAVGTPAPAEPPTPVSPRVIIEPQASPAQEPDLATRPRPKSASVPGPEVLEGCKRLGLDPPAYVTAHYIVQAPPEQICRAMAWIRAIEATAYPTLVEILGHEPAIGLHAVIFRSDIPYPAGYAGIGQFQKTGYRASRIYIRSGKLDPMPPYQIAGGVTWATICAFLDEAGHKADWKPIEEPEMLVNVFQMELYKRLDMQSDLQAIWDHQVTRRPGSRTAVLGEFWKEFGWQPFQKLIVKLHEDPEFKPTLDEGTFVYEMSVNAGRDVSGFFEERGWNISPETREGIKRQLGHASPDGAVGGEGT